MAPAAGVASVVSSPWSVVAEAMLRAYGGQRERKKEPTTENTKGTKEIILNRRRTQTTADVSLDRINRMYRIMPG